MHFIQYVGPFGVFPVLQSLSGGGVNWSVFGWYAQVWNDMVM